jgi:hypothetical protein
MYLLNAERSARVLVREGGTGMLYDDQDDWERRMALLLLLLAAISAYSDVVALLRG